MICGIRAGSSWTGKLQGPGAAEFSLSALVHSESCPLTKPCRTRTFRSSLLVLVLLAMLPGVRAEKASWRQATDAELASLLPARAQVEKEHIETEMRTASGIVNSHGRYIAGVVLITAGYSADGKYSHYLLVQSPITVGSIALKPGEYVFGWVRDSDAIRVHFNMATTGTLVGETEAHKITGPTRVESLRIWPPGEKALIQIGRFGITYRLGEE
jgi:hypothetical protein